MIAVVILPNMIIEHELGQIWITPTVTSCEGWCIHAEDNVDIFFKFTIKFEMRILTKVLNKLSQMSDGHGIGNKTASSTYMFGV